LFIVLPLPCLLRLLEVISSYLLRSYLKSKLTTSPDFFLVEPFLFKVVSEGLLFF
jgi:hypothetical protein